MQKFSGILLCTDLDGTLLREDGSISKQNIDAIEYFKAHGGLFTFITGRMPCFVDDIYNATNPNCPFGCINGGGLYDHQKQEYVWSITLPDTVLELVECVDINLPEIGIQINTLGKIYSAKDNEAMVEFRKRTNLEKNACHYREVMEPIAKIVFADTNEENIDKIKVLLDTHPLADCFGFIRSEKNLYEILSKGISKGTVLSKLAQIMGIEISKTIAVGDYNNDIEMLRTAGVGVAVANACFDAKKAADFVTVSNEEHAIAAVIDAIDKGDFWVGKNNG